jgi:hypothetical protein
MGKERGFGEGYGQDRTGSGIMWNTDPMGVTSAT